MTLLFCCNRFLSPSFCFQPPGVSFLMPAFSFTPLCSFSFNTLNFTSPPPPPIILGATDVFRDRSFSTLSAASGGQADGVHHHHSLVNTIKMSAWESKSAFWWGYFAPHLFNSLKMTTCCFYAGRWEQLIIFLCKEGRGPRTPHLPFPDI